MKPYYFSWTIRTPFQSTETYNQAKIRIIHDATQLGVKVRWRKATAPSNESQKYHFWEVIDEHDALILMVLCGDKIIRKAYLGVIA